MACKDTYLLRWRVRLYDGYVIVTKAGEWSLGGKSTYEKPKEACRICGKIHHRNRRKKLCAVCGKWFHPKKKRSYTCSPKCGHAARSLKAKESKLRPEEMPLCACGCGQRVKTTTDSNREYKDGEIIKTGEPVKFCKGHRMAKMGRCIACGKDFKLQKRKYCCSRACSNKIGYSYRRTDKLPWQIRPEKWKRIKCKVCGKFKWRKKSQWGFKVCSMSCRQKRTAQRFRKVPVDVALLTELVVNQKLCCADINRRFGCHPYSSSARTAIREAGLVPVVTPKWENRVNAL